MWPQVTRCLLLAQLGRLDEARVQLDAAAALLPAAPRDSEWLAMLAQVAETIGVIGPHPVAALDLVASASASHTHRAQQGGLRPPSDAGEVLDATARAAYRQRLRELEDEANDADATGDAYRGARVTAERDALLTALTAAYGLGGRARRVGSPAERARTAVTTRIRDAIRRIGQADPDLGEHLSRSVHTGTFCVYDPAPPVRWSVSGPI